MEENLGSTRALTFEDVEDALKLLSREYPKLASRDVELWYDMLKETGKSRDSLKQVCKQILREGGSTPNVGQVYKKLAAVVEQAAHGALSKAQVREGLAKMWKAGMRPITDRFGRTETSGGVPLWLSYHEDPMKTQCICIDGGPHGRPRFAFKMVFAQEVLDWDEPGKFRKLFKSSYTGFVSESTGEFEKPINNPKQLQKTCDELFYLALTVFQECPAMWATRLNETGYQNEIRGRREVVDDNGSEQGELW